MFKLKLQKFRKLVRDPRILVILAPFILMAPVWATGKALYWGTPSTQFIPWWHQAWQMIRTGHLPLWNPLLGMGAPLFANYQAGLLYPPNWIYFLLAELGGLPWMAWGMAPMIAIHLAWAGLGMLLLIRRLGLGILAQCVGGLAFSLSGYLVARAHFLSINAAVAWLPWILLAAYNLVQSPHAKSALKLALLLTLQWLAGHAQISWYSLILLIAWTVFWAWQVGKWSALRKIAALFVAAGLLAVALSAIQLFPTAEYLLNSQRASQVESQFALNYSFWPWHFLTLLSPHFFGSPVTGDYWGFANFWEDAVYIGLLPFLLALFALFQMGRGRGQVPLRRFLLVTVGVSFLFALGSNTAVYPWFYQNIPSFDMFQAPTRFTLWAIFGLGLLAALAANNWRRPTNRALYWSRLAVAASVAVSLTAVLFSLEDFNLVPAIVPNLVQAIFVIGLIALGISVLNLVAPKKNGVKFGPWLWVVVLFLSADLIWAGWGQNPGVDLDFYASEEGEFASLHQDLGEGRLYLPLADEEALKFERFFRFDRFETAEPARDVRSAVLPNINLLEGIPSANNFDPLLPARYKKWVETLEASGQPVREAMLARMSVTVLEKAIDNVTLQEEFNRVEALPRLRWLPCAQHVPSQEKALSLIASGEADPNKVIIEDIHLASQETCNASDSKIGQLEWLSQSPNHLLIASNAAEEGWLLLADTWYPGWRASIDGQEVSIFPADGAFRALRLPQGEHEIEFMYRPMSVAIGAVISAVAWLGVVIFWRRLEGED